MIMWNKVCNTGKNHEEKNKTEGKKDKEKNKETLIGITKKMVFKETIIYY